VKSSGKNVIEV